MARSVSIAAGLLALGILAGCASTPEGPKPAPGAAAPATPSTPGTGVAYQEDDKLGGRAWVAPGFDFRGYDTLLVGATAADVPKLNPDGVENLEWAKGVLREEIARALSATNLFGAVVTREAELKPGARTLRLEQTIVEYEKGGGGARFFAGLYGAGQPVIKVRGRLTGEVADRALFLYEARRSGDTGLARVFGGYRSDKAIQEEDIKDLARDLADFMVRAGKK